MCAKTRESLDRACTYGETAVRAAQGVEIHDLVDADQLAAAQPDLQIRVLLRVEERCVVHVCDGRWSRMVCAFLV
jgi:hypothetical protein